MIILKILISLGVVAIGFLFFALFERVDKKI